jgi:hypothetical protein
MSILMLRMLLNVEIIHKRINIIIVTTFVTIDKYQSSERGIRLTCRSNTHIIIIFDWKNDTKGGVCYGIAFFYYFIL